MYQKLGGQFEIHVSVYVTLCEVIVYKEIWISTDKQSNKMSISCFFIKQLYPLKSLQKTKSNVSDDKNT